MKKILKRLNGDTPNFFLKLRNIALIVAGTCATIVAAPVAIPVAIVTGATILGAVATAVAGVSQLTTQNDEPNQKL